MPATNPPLSLDDVSLNKNASGKAQVKPSFYNTMNNVSLVDSGSYSAASSLDLSVFSDDYPLYKIILSDIRFASAAGYFRMAIYDSGSQVTTSTQANAWESTNGDTAVTVNSLVSSSSLVLSYDQSSLTARRGFYEITIPAPQTLQNHVYMSDATYWDSAGSLAHYVNSFGLRTSHQCDEVRFSSSSGATFSGEYAVYGFKE